MKEAGTYSIIRFKMNEDNEVIATGLSLDEVKEHCSRSDTHGEGWFDGWTAEFEEDENEDA